MTLEEFRSSISQFAPPKNISVILESLWHDAKGNWDKSHELIQDLPSKDAAWIHAYLHRKEGDKANAGYWYGRAGKSMPANSLDEEWLALVKNFLV